MGNQAALIEDVGIYELWVNSAHSYDGAAELHLCKEAIVIRPSFFWLGSTATLPTMQDVRVKRYQPATTYIDGTEKTSSITVDAGKLRIIAATFKTDAVPRDEYNTAVICPFIRLFDSKGHPVLAMCEGWQSTSMPLGTATSSPPGRPPARLLPVSSVGSCLSVRLSSELIHSDFRRHRSRRRLHDLQLLKEPVRGAPNSFLRSALFAAIQGKDAQMDEKGIAGDRARRCRQLHRAAARSIGPSTFGSKPG